MELSCIVTTHEIIIGNSNDMHAIPDGSVNLIVTSPPYPMVSMWDAIFSEQNSTIAELLADNKGHEAFLKMHSILDAVWEECDRVLSDNCFVCINIGDATRTIGGNFQLYPNHVMIVNKFIEMGYSVLPDIHWRKQSNSPNKFMGSGMYPVGAYVTYEHEYILIFRKGGKRTFSGVEKDRRQKSAFFWEERNTWFSDLWDVKGIKQGIDMPKSSRDRSASFPFELPYRLINMYSVGGDTVLDPFVGLGTTMLSAIASARNSIGIEIDADIAELAMNNISNSIGGLNAIIDARITSHKAFIDSLDDNKKARCYDNLIEGYKVKTRQETKIQHKHVKDFTVKNHKIICQYE